MEGSSIQGYTGCVYEEVSSFDWRSQLQPEARQRIVNKIMETLTMHLPISGVEALHELKKIAVRFEEKIYSAATSQSDYLRKIAMKMQAMEQKSSCSGGPYVIPSTSAVASQNIADPAPLVSNNEWRSEHQHDEWRTRDQLQQLDASPGAPATDGAALYEWKLQLQPEARQRIINKIMYTLKRHLPISGPEGFVELENIAVRFEEKVYTQATSQDLQTGKRICLGREAGCGLYLLSLPDGALRLTRRLFLFLSLQSTQSRVILHVQLFLILLAFYRHILIAIREIHQLHHWSILLPCLQIYLPGSH